MEKKLRVKFNALYEALHFGILMEPDFILNFILVFADLVNNSCGLSDLAKPISIDAIAGIHTVCIWRNLIRIIDYLCLFYTYCTKISAINS